jgi:hypothetical protein
MRQTKEEYEAQAALMEMEYSPSSHTFWKKDKSLHGMSQHHPELDADTLEEISSADVGHRILAYMKANSHD